MSISDMVCAFIGMVAMRAILDRRPGTREHRIACEAFDCYTAWFEPTHSRFLTADW